MKESYVKKVSAAVLPFLKDNGYKLIKTEFVSEDNNYYLRVFIDLADDGGTGSLSGSGQEEEPEGIGIDDCVKVSRYLSKWLDRNDFIEETYTLEVCSKGFLKD